jgi:hypothetical protein
LLVTFPAGWNAEEKFDAGLSFITLILLLKWSDSQERVLEFIILQLPVERRKHMIPPEPT